MNNPKYVTADGRIIAWETPEGFQASALATSSEVLEYIAAGGQIVPYDPPAVDPKEQAKAELRESDADMARIAEDLIGALIGKGVIAESDIPQPARSKLARRAELRSKLA